MAPRFLPYEGNEKYAFISYCRDDWELCEKLVDALGNRNVRLWYDSGIHVGDIWPNVIAEHIVGSTICILLITDSFVKSTNCNNELNFSTGRNIPVIPIVVGNVHMTIGMSMMLATSQYLKIPQGSDIPIDSIMASPNISLCIDPATKQKLENDIGTGSVPPRNTGVLINFTDGEAQTSVGDAFTLWTEGKKNVQLAGGAAVAASSIRVSGKGSNMHIMNSSDSDLETSTGIIQRGNEGDLDKGQCFSFGEKLFTCVFGKDAGDAEDVGKIGVLRCETTGEYLCVPPEECRLGSNYKWPKGTMEDEYISGHEATVLFERGSFIIRCENDAGTVLNGVPMKSGAAKGIENGDRIQLGETVFTFTSFAIK